MTNKLLENNFKVDESRQRCKKYRRRILDISQQVGALHAAAAFSAMEMTDCIYHGLMELDSKGTSPDKFIMSKGHGCMVQYVILEDMGVLNRKDLDLYCKPDGRLGCHPDYGNPGIEASTGSLGHGMAIATGMAYAEKFIKMKAGKIFVVLSDGELQEGSTWESMMMAANLETDNLIVCLDHNGMQSFGQTHETHPSFYPIKEKVDSFGWETAEVNGHDSQAIFEAVTNRSGGKPFMLICNTTKGRGVSFMENMPIWHYRSPNPEEYKKAINALTEISS
jgi:transketolase